MARQFKVRFRVVNKVPGCTVFRLRGCFTDRDTHPFQGMVARQIEHGGVRLVFGLQKVTLPTIYQLQFVEASSSFLASFTAFKKAVLPRRGDVILVKVPPPILELMEIGGFLEYFRICSTVKEAIGFLTSSAINSHPN